MNVGQLKEALSVFADDTEVLISDGWECLFYKGDFLITQFEDGEQVFCDIGVGGCKEEENV